jgi:hypothetical protein
MTSQLFTVHLLTIQHRLRCRFARLKLCAHFLQASSELFDLFLQLLHLLMLFELVEQHRVDLLVAHARDFACIVTQDRGPGLHRPCAK